MKQMMYVYVDNDYDDDDDDDDVDDNDDDDDDDDDNYDDVYDDDKYSQDQPVIYIPHFAAIKYSSLQFLKSIV